jgi:hypothetical protein
MKKEVSQPSLLATGRGKLILALLCAVGFLDFVDASIVNIALPSVRHDLHMSVQSLQWLLSGYLLTYGGFMLLGGRATCSGGAVSSSRARRCSRSRRSVPGWRGPQASSSEPAWLKVREPP